jgi:hypothetical protein
VLNGKVDLSLGHAPRGTTANKVLVDLKTGGFSPNHQDDLRFYALIETVRLGTPPRRLATYYLDSGQFRVEDVTEALLWSATRRTVDGARKMAELRTREREARFLPGPGCRWCPISDTCEPGQAWLAAGADED